MSKIYAGIGSRKTPQSILKIIYDIGYKLASEGWLLRSGGATGCDEAFASGVLKFTHNNYFQSHKYQEIYIPWNGFNSNYINDEVGIYCIEDDPKANEIAARYHPAYGKLTKNAKKLMARNAYQLLGSNLDDPVRFVLAYTPDGSLGETTPDTGGTGQNLRHAKDIGIPIYNLGRDEHFRRLKKWVGE